MKLIFSFILFLIGLNLFSQTYSSVISDKEISIFFKELSKSNSLRLEKIDKEIISFNDDTFFGYDDDFDNGILKNKFVLNHLTKKDIIFLKNQYEGFKAKFWEVKDFKQKLIDSLEVKEIHSQSYRNKNGLKYYSFSIPIFSKNREYAIIIEYYYCGFMCSNQCVYFYKRRKFFKRWKQIYKWSCIAE